jgi:hypothetical protein
MNSLSKRQWLMKMINSMERKSVFWHNLRWTILERLIKRFYIVNWIKIKLFGDELLVLVLDILNTITFEILLFLTIQKYSHIKLNSKLFWQNITSIKKCAYSPAPLVWNQEISSMIHSQIVRNTPKRLRISENTYFIHIVMAMPFQCRCPEKPNWCKMWLFCHLIANLLNQFD